MANSFLLGAAAGGAATKGAAAGGAGAGGAGGLAALFGGKGADAGAAKERRHHKGAGGM